MPDLVFATHKEADCTLKELKAKKLSTKLYQWELGYILITGIGLLNTALSLGQHLMQSKEVWDLSIVGALNDRFAIDSVVEVKHIDRYVYTPPDIDSHSLQFHQRLHPTYTTSSGQASLVSVDIPVHLPSYKESLSHFDIVDMEGYALAKFCTEQKIPYRLFKCISDPADMETIERIQQKMPEFSKTLYSYLQQQLKVNLTL